MKTTFGRIFSLFATLILLCLLLLGVAFQIMLHEYLQEDARENLRSNAVTLVNLASAYEATEASYTRWSDFHIALTSSARMTEADAMLYSPEGELYLCSCDQIGCIHAGKSLEPSVVEQILTDGEYFREDTLSGIYEQTQFVEGMPIISQLSGQTIGILVLAASRQDVTGVLTQSAILFVYIAVLVLAVALMVSFWFSRSQTHSIQVVARAANRFGRGELETRVPVGKKDAAEVRELAGAFNTMAENLAQSERRRQEFVSNVSHELKTPMTTIAGFVDGMLDGTIPLEKHRSYMQLVSDEIRRLSRLVRSMLEVSRLQAQGVSEEKKRRFDLCEAIGQVLITFERRVTGKGIHMNVELPDRSVWTKADPDGITQVLYNLTDNAVKFCNQGGSLSICLTVEGGKARISVQNTGETVPPQELPLLFDRFHKADKSRSADREGVGLGLYIVKTVLNSHGEDISVTSQDGVTTFTFMLPVVR